MGLLRLLIVDDYESNRAVLQAICRKMKDFEIKEAQDGIEAIDMAEDWHPHIILMDVMMPRLDGFEASKIIKKRFPEIIIMVITAAVDPQLEANFAAIGVAAYVHKPIDKDLIRFKLQSFGALLHSKEGEFKTFSNKDTLNPFCTDVRHFKTIFNIVDTEAMMDFGMWILMRCESHKGISCSNVDTSIEFFYELMRHSVKNEQSLSIIVEENFEEIFITLKSEMPIKIQPKEVALIQTLGSECIAKENIICVRLGMGHECTAVTEKETPKISKKISPITEPIAVAKAAVVSELTISKETASKKETRVVMGEEKELLRQSFTQKTSAREYVQDIGGDVMDEIRDLSSSDYEWKEHLSTLDHESTVENLYYFSDVILETYIHALNGLFEFSAFGYALSTLSMSIKENAKVIIEDPKKLKTVLVLLNHLGEDLSSWREHVFMLQDTADIHYLDSSFFSSCMQIEGIISNKEVEADDDNDFELF